MKAELTQAQATAAALKNLSPLEKALFFSKTSPERIALIATRVAQGTVDENETREIIQLNREIKNNNNLFRNPNSPLVTRATPSIEQIVKTSGGADAIAEKFKQDRAKARRRDTANIQSCKLQYFMNKGLLPTKDQIGTLKNDIARSKQMVINMIKAKFPTSMQTKLIAAVNNSDFVTPPTATDFETSFAEGIRRKLNAENEAARSLNGIPPGDIRQLLSVFSLSKSPQDSSEPDTSNSYCDAFNYSPMSDGNYTTYGSVVLSFTTATGDESSRVNTIMHELGHSVSKAIADDPQYSNQLAGVRKCIADQHTEALPPLTQKTYNAMKAADPKASGPYTEEDFADTVAGDSDRGVRGRNSFCQLMTLSYDRRQYHESSLQAVDGDPHSASLFRLLNFEMMKKGNVPESCKSYYKTAQFSEHFSSCFDAIGTRTSRPGSANSVQ